MPLADEVETSFTTYARAVIEGRAIPDARDGLKPVQRRLLWGMWTAERATPDQPHKKSARITGSVMGRFHPHGDSALYEALARMAQPFTMSVPLVDGSGNFGSPDDPPAAARYTECRLMPAAVALLDGVDTDAVDMVENYDGTSREPVVLPANWPNLLVNGASGIAVGISTSIPPHNLREVTAAACALLENPKLSDAQLSGYVPGPDFPTGGLLLPEGLDEVYRTGRGQLKLQGRWRIEPGSRGRHRVVVYELPYTVGPEKLVERVSELVEAKRLNDVALVRNESDRNVGTQVAIETRPGADVDGLIADLCRLTPLEITVPVAFVALVDGAPRTLTLRGMLDVYLAHQLDVLQRRSTHRLAQVERRVHLLEGLVRVLDDRASLLSLLDGSRSEHGLRARVAAAFAISDEQAEYVLGLPIRRLAGMEVAKTKRELADLKREARTIKALLKSPKAQRDTLRTQLSGYADVYGTERRSEIRPAARRT